MTIFYQGSLQDGIALAMREAKAVVCFVRDHEQLSLTWEQDYFSDPEVVQLLGAKTVLLRLAAGTQEAGFLTPFCPISKFPTVVVIRNGTLQEYLTPEISKDDFTRRILAAVDNHHTPGSVRQSQNDTAVSPGRAMSPSPNILAPHAPAQETSAPRSQYRGNINSDKRTAGLESPSKSASSKRQPPQEPGGKPIIKPERKGKAPPKPTQPNSGDPSMPPVEEFRRGPSTPRAPPAQYRLQVRLFDGGSVRSSFSPNQTIRTDVRTWLDEQVADNHQPYNLKHILTPLPSRTLSISEESQTLRDLGLGSTATLVMVPVQSYTEAYATAGASLPVRGISAVYNVVSSVASTATGVVRSLLEYGQSITAEDPSSSPPAASSGNTRHQQQAGPNIRTLRDQQNDRHDNQLYNGNQLNFQPRNRQDTDDQDGD
ncbi:uncharacterized protein N7459_000677 [Penicillium hispanicum]|uniref:uncharacterized protein n=1 Tax=Penicillium hispanicum TaxID=1080232 RepID=UPI002542347E|nr:uncharacterized protein N7459_000677 [Penicillium hispanicum]KAJ5594469.1 hypothetical protein N7459_000677 [Penicillium hispanicum]